jgi:hypothetical protein
MGMGVRWRTGEPTVSKKPVCVVDVATVFHEAEAPDEEGQDDRHGAK